MTIQDALEILKQGGVLAALCLALWAILTGKVVTRREFDALQTRHDKTEQLNQAANSELQKQSSTNARLVELSLLQRQEVQDIRQQPERRPGADDAR